MKKVLIALLMFICVFGTLGSAQAIVLSPGTSIGSASQTIASYATSTTLIDSIIGQSWSHNLITGTINAWVYRDNSDGNLIFAYQVMNGATSGNGLSALTTTSFANYTTYAAYESVTGGISPLTFDRSSGAGSTVGFRFGFEAIPAGNTSDILWVKTNTPYYGIGETSIINGGAVNVNTFAPTVPEPGSLMLLGMGILGLFGLGKKRKI